MYSVSLRKDSEGKRGNYLEKGNILFAEEKKKEENIWRKKNTFWEEKKHGKGKGGKYLEKEKNTFWEEEKHVEGKGGKYLKKEKTFLGRRRKRRKIFGGEKNRRRRKTFVEGRYCFYEE